MEMRISSAPDTFDPESQGCTIQSLKEAMHMCKNDMKSPLSYQLKEYFTSHHTLLSVKCFLGVHTTALIKGMMVRYFEKCPFGTHHQLKRKIPFENISKKYPAFSCVKHSCFEVEGKIFFNIIF